MKKMLTRIAGALCAAVMLSGSAVLLPANAAEVQSARIMGDLNGDRKITMADAKKALDITVMSKIGLASSKVTAENNAADINMNGEIEMMDALSIMRYFCQTLVGDQPLWSEIRKVTYHDGTDFDPYFCTPGGQPEDYVPLPFEKRGMYLEIGCAKGKPGETVAVPVYLAGIETLAGFTYFQNTPERLELLNVESQLASMDEYEENPGEFNTKNGAFVWVQSHGENLKLTDGIVIAHYIYQIPEDAQSGETFVISADVSKTEFVACDETELGIDINAYQYTLLDGVVAVK